MCNCSVSVFTSMSFFSIRCRRGQTLHIYYQVFGYPMREKPTKSIPARMFRPCPDGHTCQPL
ncbi:hypothetical protein Bca101_082152 [Brassica carinata]